MLQQLLTAGCELDTRDRDSRSALAYAARRGHAAVVGFLLDKGLAAAQSDMHGLTPLHQAVLAKSGAVAELLLQRGADVCARDSNGLTAYKLAKRFLPPDMPESRAVLAALQEHIKALPVEKQVEAGYSSAAAEAAAAAAAAAATAAVTATAAVETAAAAEVEAARGSENGGQTRGSENGGQSEEGPSVSIE